MCTVRVLGISGQPAKELNIHGNYDKLKSTLHLVYLEQSLDPDIYNIA